MYTSPYDIPSLISSRICHDLASPLGAVSNGIELLELSGVQTSAELTLIKDSIEAANARVQFFRVAFGAPSDCEMLTPQTITTILRANFNERKIDAKWYPTESTPRSLVKLIFLLTQCVSSGAPYGATVSITQSGSIWDINVSAKALRIEPWPWALLTQPTAAQNLQPAEVHFELARAHAAEIGSNLTLSNTQTTLHIAIS